MPQIKKDYMVTNLAADHEEIFDSLNLARKSAATLSIDFGVAHITRWLHHDNERVFDEKFKVTYRNGEEVK